MTLLPGLAPEGHTPMTFFEFGQHDATSGFGDFTAFRNGPVMKSLVENGLLAV